MHTQSVACNYGTRPNITFFVIHATAQIFVDEKLCFSLRQNIMQNDFLKLESYQQSVERAILCYMLREVIRDGMRVRLKLNLTA